MFRLFQDELYNDYLGDWPEEQRIQPAEEDLLLTFLTKNQGYSDTFARKAVNKMVKTSSNISDGLYDAKK